MLRARRHERRLEAYANSTRSEERRRWARSRIQAVTRAEIPSRQEALEFAERLGRRTGSLSPPPATVLPTLSQRNLQTSFSAPNGVVQGLAIDPALTFLETGLQSSQIPWAANQMPSISSAQNVEPMLEGFRSARSPQRPPASPSDVFRHGHQGQFPWTTTTNSNPNITIPHRLYGKIITLRFSGPNGSSIAYAARIEPDCEVAQVPGQLAISLGWDFELPGTRREIFHYMDGHLSTSSLGSRVPDWLIRGMGIHLTPDSIEPELRVSICLATTPDYTNYSFLDLNQVRPHWNAPYVVISRPLLIRMMECGFDLLGLPV